MELDNFLCPEENLIKRFSPGIYLLFLQEPRVTISNLTNYSIVETGFVIGTAPSDVSYVNIGLDFDLPFQVPVIGGQWRAPLPAKAVTNSFWTYGSLHTIYAQIPYEKTDSILVRKGTNKDTDGDGYPDLIVSANNSAANQGYGYVYKSNPNTKQLETTPSTSLTDGITQTYFGSRITAGDFNGDGYDDWVFASPWNDEVFIFYSQGSRAIQSQTTNNADVSYKPGVNDNFGSFAQAGDANGDGYLDLFVSAATYSSSLGRMYIYLSNQGSLPTTPQQMLVAPQEPSPDCGAGTGCQFGANFVLDYFNSDRCIDLAVGGPTFNSNQGIVFVYHSNCDSSNPYSNPPVATLIGPPPGSCNGSTNCFFGGSLASGDTNGDGRPDLLIGSTGASSGIGDVYLVLNVMT
ncbi:FG-GAP-like repeat-containing protein [Leptospira jelokensis]|uniref:VCBS repeat-containing protein n=1 Tax=Leptospira jelokensis TaxID=2484931 RepID=A0A4Z1A218_9LEPT|nr:FG-GAP-like repeat-containing protein [Leptospira jelokensis]TGL72416.1 hypothetical protein EHQ62_06270 [Leptospira jelokensis]